MLKKYKVELKTRRRFKSIVEADSESSAIEAMQVLIDEGNNKKYDEFILSSIATVEEV